jgi:hypothetical protein
VAGANTRSAGGVGGDAAVGSEGRTFFAEGRASYRSESGHGLLKQTSPAVRREACQLFPAVPKVNWTATRVGGMRSVLGEAVEAAAVQW